MHAAAPIYCCKCAIASSRTLASYPGLFAPEFVAGSTNEGKGQVKLIMCNDIPWTLGGCMEEWYIDYIPSVQL